MTTSNKALSQPANGSAAWDVPLNANFGIIDAALGSTTSINITGISTTPVTLTATQYQSLIIKFTGTLSNNVRYNLPSGVGGQWTVYNNTSGAYSVTIGSLGGGTTIAVTQSTKAILASDGTNVFYSDDSRTPPGGSNTQVQYNNSGAFAGSSNLTFDGSALSSGGYFVLPGVNVATFGYADASANIYTYNGAGSGGVTNTVAINAGGVNRAKFDSSGNIYFNGNIGVGTISPNAKLDIASGGVLIGNTYAYSSKLSGGSTVNLGYVDGSNNFVVGDSALSGNVLFYNNGSNTLILDKNANISVGGGDQSGSGIYQCVATRGYFTRSGYGGGFNGTVFSIEDTGSLANLYFNSTKIGTLINFSDYRIKTEVESLRQGALARVCELRPVSFVYADNDRRASDGIVREGFIAHELQEIIPSAVTGEKDQIDENGKIQPQSINWPPIVAELTKAIQELKAEFDAYKAAHP